MLGETLYEEEAKQAGYVLYAENVPPPDDDLEPGALVIFTYDGIGGARWINGNVYVKRGTRAEK
jgi:hypothetical protein